MSEPLRFRVNGRAVEVGAPPSTRLTRVLRDHLGLTGTKVGCDAGDCGACTVLIDGKQACACLVPLGQVGGRGITTVEGLADNGRPSRLQRAFHEHGAAQCGICTPGMLMAASPLLDRPRPPTEAEVLDALGGVLCRCTGYRKIVRAVLAATNGTSRAAPGGECARPADCGPVQAATTQPDDGDGRSPGRYMGRRLPSVDGHGKITGRALFGADDAPDGALRLRVVRSPYAHARFAIGDCTALHARFPGLARVFTADDVPGVNGFGIYPHIKDQPVLAPGIARYRGEAVAALAGDEATLERLTDAELPIDWEPLPALGDPRDAVEPGAAPVQPGIPDNVLTRGRVHTGVVPPAGDDRLVEASGEFETPFVEHAYIEPEAGFARPVDVDRIEVSACTQTPYMDRDEVANVLGIEPERVRIRPSACGGGFGGKLDQSVQPLAALAAWVLAAPVRCIYTRTESMAATTKRHPSRMRARAVADIGGRLLGYEFDGDFDTGAYASWGPTVAGRVPVHCMGPYRVPNVRADSRAILTNSPPSGAFRGFGVPQAAIAHESLVDELAVALGVDPLEFRHRNALRIGDRTATGQVLEASAGLVACLDALRPRWKTLREEVVAFNSSAAGRQRRRGAGGRVHVVRLRQHRDVEPVGDARQPVPGRQGPVPERSAGHRSGLFDDHAPDRGRRPGPAHRQDRHGGRGHRSHRGRGQVVGVATDVRVRTCGPARGSRPPGEDAGPGQRGRRCRNPAGGRDAPDRRRERSRAHRPRSGGCRRFACDGIVLEGRGYFDPPSTALDENGHGTPYATYGFAAQVAVVEVDLELGAVTPRRVVAAHDVGAAVNPTLVEGQIEGGIAQGIGLALMEEYVPGRTENLHDYLFPSIGDVPEIESLLIEDPEPLGPYGAKGIGEPALIPTAPAILNAVHHAVGVRLRRLPILPHRVREALEEAGRHG